MNKFSISQKKEEEQKYSSSKAYNLLSPPYNPKQKCKGYINSNSSKFKPITLYSSYLSPFQNGKNLSVKNISSPDDKVSQNLMNKFSEHQKNMNSKTLGSPNTTNSDLLTSASLTSQQSNESFLSNNTNQSIYVPTSFQPVNYQMCELPKGHRYTYSMLNPQMNNIYNVNNNFFVNGNYLNMNMNTLKGNQGFINNQRQNKNVNNMNTTNKFRKFCGKNKFNNKNSNEKLDINNYASNNSSKSGSSSNKTNSDSCKISSSNNSNSNKSNAVGSSQNLSLKSKNSNKTYNNPQRKKYYNKFSSSKENSTNENTVILTLKIKLAKDDYRVFNLKKYDDLFISLEKFFDLNKIDQNLVKPIVTKIFTALNKIFWLLNNKVGIYDQEYLSSLYKLWIKNNENIPKRDENNKSKDESNNNSTISSSDSTDENKKHKKLLSNSFQTMDSVSEDEKQNTVKSI